MGAEVQARPAERDGVTGVWRGRCSHHYRQGNRDKRQPRHTGGKRIQRSREENGGGTPPPARTGGGAGRGGRRPGAGLRGTGPAAHHHFHVQGHKDRGHATFPGRATAPQAPRHGPSRPPQPRSSVEKPPGQGQAWRTPLPVPMPRGLSSPRPLPGSQACWGSPLGSVCFLSLSPESEDGGLRGSHRPSHTCTRLGFRGPNPSLPAPTSSSFPGSPA